MTACVCIIIAAYNAEATIARAVRSALAEPEAAEVIVVDDASSDRTVEHAVGADDGSGRLRVVRQEQNLGPSAARNRAVDASVSPWIGVLDADDFFLPGRLRGLLAESGEADFIADDIYQVQEHAVDGTRSRLLGEALLSARMVDFTDFVLSNVSQRGRARKELGFIKPLMRRAFLVRHGLRYQEPMRLGEDFELYARALALGAKLRLVPPQGYVAVVRPNSLSAQHSERDLQHLRDGSHRLLTEMPLSPLQKRALARHERSVDCRLQWRLLIIAVKQRDFVAAVKTFLRPYPVPAYLLRELAAQLVIRGRKRLSGS